MSSEFAQGQIPAEEDLVHTPGADSRWRESYYFSFFDEATGLGGFTSIGKRALKGHSGHILCLWGPDRPTLVSIDTDRYEAHDDNHSIAGLTYRCDEPFARWHIGFEGALNDGGSGKVCAKEAVSPPGSTGLPQHSISIDLTFVPDCPPYYYHEAARDDRWRELFDGHIDMVGRVTGSVTIDGETIDVDATGGNDHSWGVRNWFYPAEWRWADVRMEDAPHLTFWRARLGDEWFGDGAIYTLDAAHALEEYSETVETVEPDGERWKPLATGIKMEFAGGGHRRTVHGEIVRAVPVLFTRQSDDGQLVSWNDRSLVRFTDPESGATGWGNVEFSDRLERPST